MYRFLCAVLIIVATCSFTGQANSADVGKSFDTSIQEVIDFSFDDDLESDSDPSFILFQASNLTWPLKQSSVYATSVLLVPRVQNFQYLNQRAPPF